MFVYEVYLEIAFGCDFCFFSGFCYHVVDSEFVKLLALYAVFDGVVFLFTMECLLMSSKPFSCLFMPNIFCSYVLSEKSVGVMDRCMSCRHYEEFLRLMDAEDMKVMSEINEVQRKEGYSCPCDHKLCDNETVGSCFTKSSNGLLLWVCPRFNIDCFPDGAVIKEEFLRLRKGGLV